MIVERIYAHAQRIPDRTAIVFDNHELTYRQFARLIDGSRRYLLQQALPGDGVAVVAIGSVLDAWVHGLALRSLGLTTVIVRSLAEIARLDLRNTSCVVAMDDGIGLGSGELPAGLRGIRIPRALHGAAMAGPALQTPDMPARIGGHIQLTSGTTGSYKKILIDRDAEAILIRNRQTVLQLSAQTVFALFDLGGWTSAGYQLATSSWDAGGAVLMYEGPDKSQALRYDGITHTMVGPHTLSLLLAGPGLRRDDRLQVFVGGAPLSLALAQEAQSRLSSQIFDYLASSEAAVFAITPFRQPEDLVWHRILDGRTVEVVDENDRPVPMGQVGRVRVNTIANVSSYLDNDAASREFFRDGFFYPGDLGVLRADGRLSLHGRATDVVNVLGNKLAPGPIEAALQQHLGVTGVCVFSMRGESGEEVIHVTIEAPHALPRADVVAGLGTMLPKGARIDIRFVETLPRNVTGKVERDVLKQSLSAPAISL